MTLICNDVQERDLRRLAAVMVTQAMRDAANKQIRIERRLDALLWLTGEDIGWWCEWAGMSFANPWQLLTSGKLRRAKLQTKGKTKDEHTRSF